jgi:uncharacterized damage-inducible protein DinB
VIPVLSNILEQLDAGRQRIDTALSRLDDASIWRRPRPGMNSVANLCLHLAGNEHHYIGHVIGGADYVRTRSAEFTADGNVERSELIARLSAARDATRRTFETLTEAELGRAVDSNWPPKSTVLSVVLHVLEHYGYHTGQIVLLARIYQDGEDRLLAWGH